MPAALALIVIAAGCARGGGLPAPSARMAAGDEPIGVQMMRVVPELRGQRFNNLLSFESDDHLVFVNSAGKAKPALDARHAHTGRTGVRVEGGRFSVKISTLVAPGTFPGDWSLAGAYVFASQPTTMTIYCRIGEMAVGKRQLPIPAGRWTPAMLDVTPLGDVRQLVERKAAVSLALECNPAVTLWCDDFMLINNEQTLVGGDAGRSQEPSRSSSAESSDSSDGWTIRRRGLNFVGDVPGRFSFKLLTTEGGPQGWRVEEVNANRARFSSDGPQKMLTIYHDGRAYWDGEYRPLSASAAEPPFVQQHASPARLELPEEQGRVDRNTEGDANNDGYNESRGAYAVRAAGPRLELTMTPRNPGGLIRPTLEIANLPPGKVQVSLEGRLIEDVTRLEDGTVLIDLPVRITRPATVYIKVE